jgi:hypothetical protein
MLHLPCIAAHQTHYPCCALMHRCRLLLLLLLLLLL